MKEIKRRRKRGPAAIGDFETAKQVAEQVIKDQQEANRLKSERLRKARLANEGKDANDEA